METRKNGKNKGKEVFCLICHTIIPSRDLKKEGFVCPSCGAPKSQFAPLTGLKPN